MFRCRIKSFRSAGVSPALKSAGTAPALKKAGGTPALRGATSWLAAVALAFACADVTLAQTAPKQPAAKKAVRAPDPYDPFSAQPGSDTRPATKKAGSTHSGRTTIVPGTSKAGGGEKAGGTYSGTTTLSGGIGELPATLDQTLTMALETSPKVMVAKARVTIAEAELSAAQMEVARKTVELWTAIQTQQLAYRQNLEANRRIPGTVPTSILIGAGAQLAQLEMELRCLMGQTSLTASRGGSAKTATPFERPAKPLQLPHGVIVQRIRDALCTPTEVVFVDEPLQGVVDYLKERHMIEIQFDVKALQSVGIGRDMPVTVDLKGLTLGDLFQYWEDTEPKLKFVVRHYGILVTTPERAREQGYFPAVEFVQAADRETHGETPRDLKPATPPGN